MKRRFIGACALLLLGTIVFAQPATTPQREFRAVWVTRFEWPDPDAGICRANIDEIMKTVAAHRFNAVIFQMRGQCDTLYPSPEEPWSPFISPTGSAPGWDPLVYAIQVAHANHLEFHAYINTHVAWQSREHGLPVAMSHVFYKHFNAVDPRSCDWLAHNGEGKPVQWGEDDYAWIAPGVPEAQAYVRRQIMHVVRNYDVDGVHFDRIRTAGAEFSHDPIAMARLASEDANPGHLPFDAWTTDQITRFVRDIYAQINEVKPQLKVSSAPLGLTVRDRYPEYPDKFHFALSKCHQDAQAWLSAGAMDFVVPQIYWSDHDNKPPDFSRVLPDWIEHGGGRHIYPGMNSNVGGLELVHQIQVSRRQGGLGNVIFSYSGVAKQDKFSLFSRGRSVYSAPAGTPAMPWKDSPSEGVILGTVTDERTGQPVVDAQVRRTGSEEVALSSADGLFSFLKVPPGQHSLSVRKSGWPEARVPVVAVVVGKVARADARLSGGPVVVAAANPQPTTAGRPTRTPTTGAPAPAVVITKHISAWRVVGIIGCLFVVGLTIAVVVMRLKKRRDGEQDE